VTEKQLIDLLEQVNEREPKQATTIQVSPNASPNLNVYSSRGNALTMMI